jgi:hypothetical protein
MLRWIAFLAVVGCGGAPHPQPARAVEPAAPQPVAAPDEPATPTAAPERSLGADQIRCDSTSNADLSIDGLLDDWHDNKIVAHAGVPGGAVALRCSWDGTSLALALAIDDDRVVRVRGRGDQDRVDVTIAARGGRPITASVLPGNAIAGPKIAAPRRVRVADSLQPKGFSIEMLVPASAIPELSQATSELALRIVFHDSDQATGGAASDVPIDAKVELAERKDLFDDFLAAVHLQRTDIKLDVQADLDPDHRGKERLVAGGTVIGVLTDQYGFVTLPAQSAADVLRIELLPLGPRGSQVISAVVRQTGNGGSRDLLLLWTVWSGQLTPLGQLEVRKQQGASVLESEWKVDKGKLVVTPKPAIGWTARTWNEQPAEDADPILLPWDRKVGGTAYTLTGKDLARRELPARKR